MGSDATGSAAFLFFFLVCVSVRSWLASNTVHSIHIRKKYIFCKDCVHYHFKILKYIKYVKWSDLHISPWAVSVSVLVLVLAEGIMLWSTLWLLQSGFNHAAGFLDLSLKNMNKHKTVKQCFHLMVCVQIETHTDIFLLSKMPETCIKLLMKLMNKTFIQYNIIYNIQWGK